jgi:hypothetical protein
VFEERAQGWIKKNDPGMMGREVCWVCDQHRYTLICFQRESNQWVAFDCNDRQDVTMYPVICIDKSPRIALAPSVLFAMMIDRQQDEETYALVIKHLIGTGRLKSEQIAQY